MQNKIADQNLTTKCNFIISWSCRFVFRHRQTGANRCIGTESIEFGKMASTWRKHNR